jgi:hypothetical protein
MVKFLMSQLSAVGDMMIFTAIFALVSPVNSLFMGIGSA